MVKKQGDIFLTRFDNVFCQYTLVFNNLCGGKDKKWEKMKTIHLSKTILLTNITRIKEENDASYTTKVCPSKKKKIIQ